jgi:hypothetical protein
MGPLGPLLMYMVFGLPNSAEQCIRRSSFGLVERGAEGGPGESDSAAMGRKSAGNRPILPINRPGAKMGREADRIGGDGKEIGRAQRRVERRTESAGFGR